MTFPQQYKSELFKAIDSLELDKVNQAIEWFKEARAAGKHIFVCGNGGSASTASHFACDIVKGASFNRSSRFRIMALTDQLPTLTAYANDVSYDAVFVEQLKNFAEPGDLFMGISGSGNSPNVLRPLAQLNIQAPVPHMGRIEDAHMIVCHMIGYYFMEEGGQAAC